MRPRLARISKDNVWFAWQVLRDLLDQLNFVTACTVKVTSQNSQSLDDNRIWVALDGVKGFHAGKELAPLVDLRYQDPQIDHVKGVRVDIDGFLHGVNFLVLAIGIYGIGEMLWTLESTQGTVTVHKVNMSLSKLVENIKDVKTYIKTTSLGSVLGYFVGTLPAAGATPASLMSYGLAKTFSKDPESFGKGNVAGVAAPEAANNAASTGSMLPMITLGIPGSPTTAILLGGMIIWGLRPGPLLFTENPEFVWGLIGSLYIANLATLLINIAFIPLFVRVLTIPFTILAPIIYILCVVGGYAPTQTMHDVWLMLLFGIVGYLLRKLNYPVAPAVLAIVLGPLAERSLRQSLLSSQGEMSIFVTRPISAICILIAIGLICYPLVQKFKKKSAASETKA